MHQDPLLVYWVGGSCLLPQPCPYIIPHGVCGLLHQAHWQSVRTEAWCQTLDKPINSLASRKFEWNFWNVIFEQVLVLDIWGISCEIAQLWKSLHFTYDQSTLVQVMAWCRQATSHYLSQCWHRSLSPYGVTRPEWVSGTIYGKKNRQIKCIIKTYHIAKYEVNEIKFQFWKQR